MLTIMPARELVVLTVMLAFEPIVHAAMLTAVQPVIMRPIMLAFMIVARIHKTRLGAKEGRRFAARPPIAPSYCPRCFNQASICATSRR